MLGILFLGILYMNYFVLKLQWPVIEINLQIHRVDSIRIYSEAQTSIFARFNGG